jgi:hypothetical protein
MGLFKKDDPRARLESVEKSGDTGELIEAACSDDSPRVRLAAVAKLNDDETLSKVALDAKELDVRIAAVERISSQQLLADIIKARKNYELMGACFARITDRKILEAIAQDTGYNPTARRIAVEQFADESYLEDVSKAKEEKDTGRGEAAIDRLLEASGDLRVVRAIGRFRHSEKAARALGAIAKKGGESGGLAVEYLCRALGSSNPKVQATAKGELAGLSDPELVSLLVRSLDDPKLREPVRDVLKQINTPEARKALGQE